MVRSPNHTTYPWPAGRAPAHPGFTARQSASRPAVTRAPSLSQAPPRPRACLPAPRERGRGPSGPSRPGRALERDRGRPGTPRPVPVSRPAVPGVCQAQPTPSAPASILSAPGTPTPHSWRPPDRERLQVPLLRAAHSRPPPAAAPGVSGGSSGGRVGLEPRPTGETGPAHRSWKVKPSRPSAAGIAEPCARI